MFCTKIITNFIAFVFSILSEVNLLWILLHLKSF